MLLSQQFNQRFNQRFNLLYRQLRSPLIMLLSQQFNLLYRQQLRTPPPLSQLLDPHISQRFNHQQQPLLLYRALCPP